jgi:hypothetical protein
VYSGPAHQVVLEKMIEMMWPLVLPNLVKAIKEFFKWSKACCITASVDIASSGISGRSSRYQDLAVYTKPTYIDGLLQVVVEPEQRNVTFDSMHDVLACENSGIAEVFSRSLPSSP